MGLPECIDLAGGKSMARITLAGMNEQDKLAFDKQIEKTLKAKINKEVKGTILDVAHRELLEKMNVEHLTNSVSDTREMIHALKPTLAALLQTEHAIKFGDWVEVLYEYAPGTCSDGGVGSIVKIERDADERAWCTVAYVLDNRVESRIDQNRITVTIMSFKDLTSTKRKGRARQAIVVEENETRKYEPPDRTPIEWLQ
jgi:hypothetical protein